MIRAILRCEISGETNVGNYDTINDAVGCHGYRRSGHTQYTRPRTADWPGRRRLLNKLLVSSLFNNLVNVIMVIVMSTCVKLDSVVHFLVYKILNYKRVSAPQT